MASYFLIGMLLVVCLALLTVPYLGGKTLTGRATVVSKRTELGRVGGKHSSSWNYLVTFRLSDGEELELYTFEAIYAQLKEGTAGTLHWQKDTLSSFDADPIQP